MKQYEFMQKLNEIRENISETGKDQLLNVLPKARIYFPHYHRVQTSQGLKKLVIREYEVLRLRAIEKLFRVEAGVLKAILRQHVLPIDLAFAVSIISNEIHDLLAKKAYAEQINLLRQL